MPSGRPRRELAGRPILTPRLDLALVCGPAPGRDDDLTDGLLAVVYEAFRERYNADTWAFRRFEPDVPARDRPERPKLVEVPAEPAPGAPRSPRRARDD